MSEVSLSIRNEAMQLKSEVEERQSFGVARMQADKNIDADGFCTV